MLRVSYWSFCGSFFASVNIISPELILPKPYLPHLHILASFSPGLLFLVCSKTHVWCLMTWSKAPQVMAGLNRAGYTTTVRLTKNIKSSLPESCTWSLLMLPKFARRISDNCAVFVPLIQSLEEVWIVYLCFFGSSKLHIWFGVPDIVKGVFQCLQTEINFWQKQKLTNTFAELKISKTSWGNEFLFCIIPKTLISRTDLVKPYVSLEKIARCAVLHSLFVILTLTFVVVTCYEKGTLSFNFLTTYEKST